MSIEIGDGGLGYIYLGDVLIAGGGGGSKPPFTPGDNTLAWYKLNGNANDSSGNGNNGTPTNISYVTDNGIQVANFTGGYITIPSLGVLSTSLTVNLRMKSSQASGTEYIMVYLAPSGDNKNLSVGVYNTYAKSYRWNGSTSVELNSSTVVNNGVWHNIVVSVDGSNWKIYVDGTLKNTISCSHPIESGIYSGFGDNIKNKNRTYNGYLSEIILENKVWTEEEIYKYYNDTKRIYNPPIKPWTPGANTLGYYTFDDQNTSQITDFSGNNRNLTGGSMPGYTLVSGTNYAGNFTTGSGIAPTNTSYGAMDGNSTVLAWVKPTGNGSGYVSSYSGSGPNQFALIRGYRSGQFEYFNQLGNTNLRTTIKSGVTLNNWYLIGYTKSGTSVKTYCNGVAGGTLTDGTNSNNKNLHIGSSDAGDRFQGQIGVLIVENRIWTDSEISAYYNLTKSNYGL